MRLLERDGSVEIRFVLAVDGEAVFVLAVDGEAVKQVIIRSPKSAARTSNV